MTGVINVLHVDDELIFLQLTEKYLKVLGGEELKVYSLSDPLKVFKELEEKSFDVIVTDYQMPGMDGLELLGMLRDQNNDIPVMEQLNRWADYFGITTHLPKVIEVLNAAIGMRYTDKAVIADVASNRRITLW